MAFTRFHDDPARIRKTLEESTFAERYYLNKPGNGVDINFQTDPQLRLQGWGANLCSDAINVESDFRGLSRKLTRDVIENNNYKMHAAESIDFKYGSSAPIVDESRATHPAWMFRDLEHSRWETPFINPQDNVECPFNWNVQTRILEKDFYKSKMPVVNNVERTDFYLPR